MRCGTMKKWLSDDLDGALAPKKKACLEAHLRECPGCRAYRSDLVGLQAGASAAADRSPEYWASFERRLESKLAAAESGRKTVGAPFFARRAWAWTAAGFLVLVAVGTYFAIIRPGATWQTAWAPYEDSLDPLLQEAEASPEIGNLVNREILALIADLNPVTDNDFASSYAVDPLFWEGLTDEELEYLAAEMKKETGRGGPQ